MASYITNLLLFVLFHTTILLSYAAKSQCTECRDGKFLEDINVYRTLLNLPLLISNRNAACLADKVADKLDSQACNRTMPFTKVKLDNFSDDLTKCGIYINHTTDSVLLPVCVPKLDPNQVLTNFTETQYAKYIKCKKYTGAGIGSQKNWVVVVLTTNSTRGDFGGAKSSGSKASSGQFLVLLLLGMFVYMTC